MTIPYVFGVFGLFVVPLLAILVPIYIGQYYGNYRKRRSETRNEATVGAVSGAALALLGFMLAFTFQIASNRFSQRKDKLIESVSHIRTTWLRASLIPEPYQSNTKKHLVEYVDLAVGVSSDFSTLSRALTRSQQLLDSLWTYAEGLAAQDRSSEVYALYTASVNDVIATHHQRVTLALEYRVPVVILWILFIVAFLSMLAFGYQIGSSGKPSFKLNLLLAATFAVVMTLIFALDRPEAGLARLSQKPMKTLQQQLHGN